MCFLEFVKEGASTQLVCCSKMLARDDCTPNYFIVADSPESVET